MEIAPEQADALLEKGMISPETHASILGKLNDALVGDNPEYMDRMRSGKMTPLDVASALGRGYDSLVGAPTRAAISAGAKGENPVSAAAGQFGKNPDTAPDFGMIGNAVADPFVLSGAARGVAKAGASMIEHAPQILGNEAGELRLLPGGGKSARTAAAELSAIPGGVTPERELMEKAAARYTDSPEMVDVVNKTMARLEKSGATENPYVNMASGKSPWGDKILLFPNPHYEIQDGVMGKITKNTKFGEDPLGWHDQKWGVAKNALAKANGPLEINTGSDLVGHEDYARLVPPGSTVNFHFNSQNQFGGLNSTSASFKRLTAAAENLKKLVPDVKVNFVDVAKKTPSNVSSLPTRFSESLRWGANPNPENGVKGMQLIKGEE